MRTWPLFVLLFAGVTAITLATEPAVDSSRLPGVSAADNQLQRNAAEMLWMLEGLESVRNPDLAAGCELTERRIINTEVTKLPKKPGRSPWKEKWTVDRCGDVVYYSIKFTPTPKQGGTDFEVSLIED